MKIIKFLLVGVLFGCTYTKKDAYVTDAVGVGWNSTGKVLTYSCQNNHEISIFLNQPIATLGSTCFIAGVVPIGKASYLDQKLNFSVSYKPKEKECNAEDIYWLLENEKLHPSSLWSQGDVNGSCLYLWSNDLKKIGEFSIYVDGIQGCDIPPIKVMYRYKSSYNYDRLGG